MNKISKEVIKKWEPVVENVLPFKNKFLIYHLCNYCEWYSNNNQTSDLVEQLQNIENNIINSKRVEIVRKVINKFTGLQEYELSNGKYIGVNVSYYELSIDELIEVLGLEYIKFYDPIEFRDKQIDKIIL